MNEIKNVSPAAGPDASEDEEPKATATSVVVETRDFVAGDPFGLRKDWDEATTGRYRPFSSGELRILDAFANAHRFRH